MTNKSEMILSAIIAAGIIVSLATFSFLVFRKTKEMEKYREETIGKAVVIDGDTLTVIRWSSGSIGTPRGFVLSNGVTIDENYINKIEL